MKKKMLLTPGPTPVPEDVLLSMAAPILHHRTPEFSSIFAKAKEGLKYLFQTKEDVLILASSGTGAMESSVTNLFSKGDKVLVINSGKFGERWEQICSAYELEVTSIKVPWGQAVSPEDVKTVLTKSDFRGVFIQASETSTTVRQPVKEIGLIVKELDSTLLIVDGITAVGVYDIPMDKWNIDVLVTGSQKALMLPPGLAFIALSDKAWNASEKAALPKYYFDLKKEKKNLQKDTTAYTPAVTLIIGLNSALEYFRKEGLENIFRHNNQLAKTTREAVKAMGLSLLAPDSPSSCATGVYLPDNIDGGKLVKWMRDAMGISVAGGQDHLKGKIIRIAHMGYIGPFDIISAISALEMALIKFGYNSLELGKGVSVAERHLLNEIFN